MKNVLTRDDRLAGGGLVGNLELLRFARHYGVKVRVCRPYRAKTKGKVERPIRYLRESLLYSRTFLGDADLNAQAVHWLATVANVRRHGTTKAVPAERFATEEQATLQALPARPYRSLLVEERRPPSAVHPPCDHGRAARRRRAAEPRRLRGAHGDRRRGGAVSPRTTAAVTSASLRGSTTGAARRP